MLQFFFLLSRAINGVMLLSRNCEELTSDSSRNDTYLSRAPAQQHPIAASSEFLGHCNDRVSSSRTRMIAPLQPRKVSFVVICASGAISGADVTCDALFVGAIVLLRWEQVAQRQNIRGLRKKGAEKGLETVHVAAPAAVL